MADCETVLITGASSGIGADLAKLFAADGATLILVARRRERLQDVAAELTQKYGVRVEVIAADLSVPSSVPELVRAIQDRQLSVDVLVNCAGFGDRGPVVSLSEERQMSMLHVNVCALTQLTRIYLPEMVARRRGGILNVASTAAFQPGPNMAVYYASKAYVLSFSEALAEESRGSGVSVSCLCPGATQTEFADVAKMEDSRLFRLGAMRSTDVAASAYRGFRAGKTIIIPGVKNKLGAFSVRFLPRGLVRRLVAHLQ